MSARLEKAPGLPLGELTRKGFYRSIRRIYPSVRLTRKAMRQIWRAISRTKRWLQAA